MGFPRSQTGASLLEIMAALALFALAAVGLAVALPLAQDRTEAWRTRQNLARYLESQLEDLRSRSFSALPVEDSGWQQEGSSFRYRRVTAWVQEGLDSAGRATWQAVSPGTGDGLWVFYYDKHDSRVYRKDPTVNFNWGNGSPDPSIQQNWFNAHWRGYLYVPATGTYQFFTQTDAGARLWINNQLLIDNWESPVTSERSASMNLTGKTFYPLRMDYFEDGGAANARLSWSGPGIAKQIIPTGNLYSRLAKMTTVTVGFPDKPDTLEGRLLSFADESVGLPGPSYSCVTSITGNYFLFIVIGVDVTIQNHLGQPVAGAVVSAHWTGLTGTNYVQATTDSSGIARFSNLYITGLVTFTVDNVQATPPYDPTRNIVTSVQL
ncbi:MAG TPA: hypothetical protein GX391_03780 [Firmicutes bacterium]|jgi:type II secretory pathway pseudopilin PulG|nr:hypothetical protein [Bacillota bacterium]HOQ23329.1 PA14 domain-containing protein [Bacillota bacterium]HPT66749.1 PA14 domain-containing protein [Bacillota bacterium]